VLIEVKGYPEYTRTQVVRPDGKITVPSVGDIYVQGLTIPEINVAVTEGLKKELSQPSINVQLVASTSKAIYVLGEVRFPGLRPYFGDMRLIDAIASAQGVTFNGDWHKVLLTRESLDHPQLLMIDLRKLVDKGAAEENVVLEDGDIIYVTPTVFAKVGYAFDQLLLPFRSILGGLVTYGGVRTATSNNL
jgi:polysaccharide export outer membrane protein